MTVHTISSDFLAFTEPPQQDIAILSKCKIRTWQRKDIAQVRQYLDDASVWRYLSADYPGGFSLKLAEHYLAIYTSNQNAFFFAAALLDSDEVIGGVSAELGTGVHSKSAEYGGWLAKPYWRSGIARDVTTAFTDWLFSTQHVLRVHSAPFHLNRASIGTLQASGFSFEGRLRCSVVKDGCTMNQMQYAKINPTCQSTMSTHRSQRL